MQKPLAVVLAAGKGTRMKSELPKVLVPVAERPMIEYVLDALQAAGVAQTIVVVGYRADAVRDALANRRNLTFVEQTQQLGTGHAVMVCRDVLQKFDGPALVVTGDSPLMQQDSLRALLDDFAQHHPACLLGTTRKDNPAGLGRILRDDHGNFVSIVEEKDATSEQRQITEVNMSCYVFDCRSLLHALDGLTDNNAQKEYYITDCPGILKREGRDVRALPVLKPIESLSINTVDELKVVEVELLKLREQRTA